MSTPSPALTEEMRQQAIGLASPLFTTDVEKGAIIKFAEAIEDAFPDGTELFGGQLTGDVGTVLEIAIRVEWFDGSRENFIERVTLAVGTPDITNSLPAELIPLLQ